MFGFFPLDFFVYLLLAVVAAYVAVQMVKSNGVAKRRKVIAGAMAFFIVWLIPFWDWIPTILYHRHLCNTEAGVKIYKRVEGVEGFLGEGPWPLSIGYRYGYGENNLGGYVRYRENPDKSSFKPWVEESTSQPPEYGVKFEQLNLNKWNAWKLIHTVYVVRTGEVLATFTDFGSTAADPEISMSEWRKPWLSGRSCFQPHAQPKEASGPITTEIFKDMLLNTLKPVHKKN